MPGKNCMRTGTYLDYSETVFLRRDLNKFEKYILLFIAQKSFAHNHAPVHLTVADFMLALDFTAAGYIKHVHQLRDRGFVRQDVVAAVGSTRSCKYSLIFPLPPEQGA